jgi:hypothetical protein
MEIANSLVIRFCEVILLVINETKFFSWKLKVWSLPLWITVNLHHTPWLKYIWGLCPEADRRCLWVYQGQKGHTSSAINLSWPKALISLFIYLLHIYDLYVYGYFLHLAITRCLEKMFRWIMTRWYKLFFL